jgi:PAS domain S-box-containing protein
MAAVLIADDEAANRALLRLLLTERGHQVVEATDGRQALDLVRSSPPDLVVSDALMPGMDGYELARAIRDDPATASLPVVLFSGNYSEDEMGSIADSCGASRVIAKTANPAVFLHTVEEILTDPEPPPAASAADFDSQHRSAVTSKLLSTARELRLTEAKFSELAEAAPVGIFLTDPMGDAVYANPVLASILGTARDDLLGRGWRRCLGGHVSAQIPALARGDASRPAPEHHQSQIAQPDGSRRWLDVTIQPLPHQDGQPAGAVGIVSDITLAMQSAERQQAEQRRQLLEASQRTGDRLEALRRMAGGIAHDYNNILGGVLAYAQFLTDTVSGARASERIPAELADELQADISELREAGNRAIQTTAVLHRFSSQLAVTPSVHDVSQITREECAVLADSLEDKIRLDLRLDSQLPAARVSTEHIIAILGNLTSNSVDAMPGGGTLTIATACVEVGPGQPQSRELRPARARRLAPGRYVKLTVADTGAGMTADVLEHAIEPFYTTRAAPHTGLGLAAVYGAIFQLGGDLVIESEQGTGTSVDVYVPAIAEPAVAPSAPAAALADQQATILVVDDVPAIAEPAVAPSAPAATLADQQATILVVDDEPAIRDVSARVLRRAGYTVLVAANGPDALQVAGQHQGTIHYLLTDVVMPQMLGSELARQLTAARPDTRVLYMSGYAEPMRGDDACDAAQFRLINKPFTPDQLLTALAELP